MYRRLGAATADRLALPGWQPLESAPLGEWVLRSSRGFSSRGNSVLALGVADRPLEDAVDTVAHWYLARSLPARAHVLPGGPEAEAFARAGWSVYESTQLMLSSVSRVLRRLGPDRVAEPRHDATLDASWLATDERSARFGDDARLVLEAGEVTFATVRDEDDAVLARGRGTLHGDWVGVSCLWTREDLRGTGLGSAVLETLLEWGAERGATTSYLQVVESNSAAIGLYQARGFEAHHRYDYLVADQSPD